MICFGVHFITNCVTVNTSWACSVNCFRKLHMLVIASVSGTIVILFSFCVRIVPRDVLLMDHSMLQSLRVNVVCQMLAEQIFIEWCIEYANQLVEFF